MSFTCGSYEIFIQKKFLKEYRKKLEKCRKSGEKFKNIQGGAIMCSDFVLKYDISKVPQKYCYGAQMIPQCLT